MPQGYDTLISEDGGNLSQGQKQLLSIARVMLVDTGMDDETRRLAEDVCSRLGQGLYTYEEFEKVLASGLQ